MDKFRRIASRVDDVLDRTRLYWRTFRGHDAPVVVHPHRGFGTADRLTVRGHVVIRPDERERRRPAIWNDIRSTIRRYIEREVMGASLTVRLGDSEVGAVSDSDGHFRAELPVTLAPSDRVEWHEVEVVLERWPGGPDLPATFATEVMVPPADARFGVISDIDDTVLRTGISDLMRNWRQVIRSDPSMREAFPGLPELYRALSHDRQGVQRNPIFYVSSAAWGFYDLFEQFLALQEIPQGPIFLKNYGLQPDQWFKGSHGVHKTAAIERLFDTYPRMPFILVGDSGQHDAMIYRDVARRHPGRVKAVWIREVAGRHASRRGEIGALIDELNAQGVPAAFGPDLLAAAREAAAAGWIEPEAIAEVEAAVAHAPGGA